MSKNRSTGFVRAWRRRRAKLSDGGGLSRYERYLKATNANKDAIAKEAQ